MAVGAMSQETRSQQYAIFVIEELERVRSLSAATEAATAEGPIASACCRCCSPTLCGSQGDHNRNLPEVAAAAESRGGGPAKGVQRRLAGEIFLQAADMQAGWAPRKHVERAGSC